VFKDSSPFAVGTAEDIKAKIWINNVRVFNVKRNSILLMNPIITVNETVTYEYFSLLAA
jgi:hypothetical protein